MTEKKLLLLDLDNTLWDFDANAEDALTELFHRHHLHLRSSFKVHEFVDLYKIVNATFWRRYEKGEIDKDYLRTARFTDTFLQMGIPEEEHPENIWEEYLAICPVMTRLVPGAMDFLKAVSSFAKIGLITNGFGKTQHLKIEHSGISPYVSFMVTSETEGVAKPNVGIFMNALKLGGSSPELSMYMGDIWETDVVGGTNAGIPTLWFNRENALKPSMPLTNPDLYLGETDSLAKAISIVKNRALV